MNEDRHPKREDLIDFAEGELSQRQVELVETHLETCRECACYVESLRRTYSLLASDSVPEPAPAYFVHLAQRVRKQAKSRRTRRLWVLVPGAAAAAFVLMILLWGGEVSLPEPDSIDLLLAEMNVGEVVESVSGISTYDEFAEVASDEITVLEEYFTESDDVYGLLDALSNEEREKLVLEIMGVMRIEDDEGTS
jgi:anti-sigma factor ChrR (cupin superfamily)